MRMSCRAFLVLVVLAVASGACSKRRLARHSGGGEAAAALAPTPDNTPVEALRTPAGLVLKAGPEPTATPLPAAAEAASPAAQTKS